MRGLLTGPLFPLVFHGDGLPPFPWLDQLGDDVDARRSSFERAEEVASSMLYTNDLLRASADIAATYARSLEHEVAKLRGVINAANVPDCELSTSGRTVFAEPRIRSARRIAAELPPLIRHRWSGTDGQAQVIRPWRRRRRLRRRGQ